MRNNEVSSAHEYYNKVINTILSHCSKAEKEAKDDCCILDRLPFGDLILPKGCQELDIKGPALIELKVNLTLSISAYLKKVKKQLSSEYNLYVIYLNNFLATDDINLLSNNAVYFRSASSLKGFNSAEHQIKDHQHKYKMQGRRTLFVGAGVSIDAGLPKWEDLLENLKNCIEHKNHKELAENILKPENKDSLIIKAQKITELLIMSGIDKCESIRTALWGTMHNKLETSPLIDAIVELIRNKEVDAIITYNYDDIIERRLDCCNEAYSHVLEGDDVIEHEGIPILHVHGYIPKTKTANLDYLVLDESSYHKLYNDNYTWTNIEQLHYLRNSNCVFVGFSMQDPNLRRLLELSNLKYMTKNRSLETSSVIAEKHCVFLKRKEHGETDSAIDLTSKIMSRLGLTVIWFDDFKELPNLLCDLFQRNKRQNKAKDSS